MNIPITINNPTLVAGQQFKVEYSTDNINWTFDSYQNTNSFLTTYSGFQPGETYYFRITIVQTFSPYKECDSVTFVKTMRQEVECITNFSLSIVEKKVLGISFYTLVITYTPPDDAPCGGYVLKHGTSYPLQSTNYTSLPASPIQLPISNQTQYVEIYVVDCDGNEILCSMDSIEPYTPPVVTCTPGSIHTSRLYRQGGNYYLELGIIPSTPPSASYTVSYAQVNTNGSGVPDSGLITIPATGANPQVITVQITPNFAIRQGLVYYSGSVTDGCGNTIPFSISADL